MIHYTIGQRKGLGIAYKHPLFVKALRMDTNEVILAADEDLYATALIANNPVWSAWPKLSEPLSVKAKIRYRATAAPATLYPLADDQVGLIFAEPQRAITPGQAVVCYKDDLVLGGATIMRGATDDEILKGAKCGDDTNYSG